MACNSAAQIVNSFFDQSAVDFQLLFTRPAHADAALDTFQVRPHPLQPRQRILQLRQLDRQSGFIRLRSAGKDVENQFGPIQHFQSDDLFQIARLARRQIVVENHHVGIGGGSKPLQFFHFAARQDTWSRRAYRAAGSECPPRGPRPSRPALPILPEGVPRLSVRSSERRRETPFHWRHYPCVEVQSRLWMPPGLNAINRSREAQHFAGDWCRRLSLCFIEPRFG